MSTGGPSVGTEQESLKGGRSGCCLDGVEWDELVKANPSQSTTSGETPVPLVPRPPRIEEESSSGTSWFGGVRAYWCQNQAGSPKRHQLLLVCPSPEASVPSGDTNPAPGHWSPVGANSFGGTTLGGLDPTQGHLCCG